MVRKDGSKPDGGSHPAGSQPPKRPQVGAPDDVTARSKKEAYNKQCDKNKMQRNSDSKN